MNRRLVLRISLATIVMVMGLSATAALGLWQYSVAHRDEIARKVISAPAVPLATVSVIGEYVPESAYGQLVTLSGKLLCADGFSVKPLANSATWNVCPVSLDDGSKIAIAFDQSRQELNLNETVSLTGRLQPAQDSSPLTATYRPSSTSNAINTDDLVLRWTSDVHDGYVVATQVTPQNAAPIELNDIPSREIVTPPVGIDLRNLLYAWQWWVFGVFAALFYGRFVRDELRAHTGVAKN